MPTYQYACTECGHELEAVQSFSDASLTVCPQCEGRLRKVFSAVGVVFKGSGFYRTDSRKATTASSPAATGNGTSNGDNKSAPKSDSKSDSKSESTSDSKSAAAPAKPAPSASTSSAATVGSASSSRP